MVEEEGGVAEEDVASLKRKVKRAAHLLLFRSHTKPGVKGWELKRALGRDYLRVIDLLNEALDDLGLQVKVDLGGEGRGEGSLSSARFYIVLKEAPTTLEVKGSGWRIDDLAALAATLMYILSRQGKAPSKEVEKMLKKKFPDWRVEYNLERFIRMGYLAEDDEGMIHIGWRTRAEIDRKTLLEILLGKEAGKRERSTKS